jgi:hypothetical protein
VNVSEAPTSSLKICKVRAAGVEAGSGHFPVNSGPAEGELPEGLPRAFCPGVRPNGRRCWRWGESERSVLGGLVLDWRAATGFAGCRTRPPRPPFAG